jgi:mono/diheme cytochrome c family protein
MHGRGAAPVLLLCLVLAAGCGTVKSPTEPQAEPGGVAFTFSRIQAEVFTPSCALAGCHAADSAEGGMVLAAGRSYAEIVNRSSTENPSLDRVEPGDSERSYLLKKLRGDPDITGERMPLGGPPLTREQIDGIAAWIRAGAPNN